MKILDFTKGRLLFVTVGLVTAVLMGVLTVLKVVDNHHIVMIVMWVGCMTWVVYFGVNVWRNNLNVLILLFLAIVSGFSIGAMYCLSSCNRQDDGFMQFTQLVNCVILIWVLADWVQVFVDKWHECELC